jgi:hypothetical protein
VDPSDLTKPGDGRPTPRRVYNGAVVIFAGFMLMYLPYFVTGEEWPAFGIVSRVMSSFPVAGGYALVAIGVANIILGCIDYARLPR